MSDTEACGAIRSEHGDAVTLHAADWLCLAATPAFAIMALLAGMPGGRPDLLCSAVDALPLNGMVPMYLLMTVSHAAPWLRLIARRRGGARRP